MPLSLSARLAVFAFAGSLLAQAPVERMRAMSVPVFGSYRESGAIKYATRGGGFVAGSRHVVTSLGACCGRTRQGTQLAPAVLTGENLRIGKVVWSSEDMDIAILEMPADLDAPSVTLLPMNAVREGQSVYILLFGDEGQGGARIAQGAIQGTANLESGVQLLKSTAQLTQGNDGGALFDACGNTIGVNYVFRNGATYSVIADPLVDALDSIGVRARVTKQACGGGSSSPDEPASRGYGWRPPRGYEWVGLLLLIGIGVLAFRPARNKVAQTFTGRQRAFNPPPPPYAPPPGMAYMPPLPVVLPAKPVLRGVSGPYAGQAIGLEEAPGILGRDPKSANLVFPSDAAAVSKRHCTIRWDAFRRVFVLEDHGSTNGTFLATGERLPPSQPRDLPPGQRFYVGDFSNQFEVALE